MYLYLVLGSQYAAQTGKRICIWCLAHNMLHKQVRVSVSGAWLTTAQGCHSKSLGIQDICFAFFSFLFFWGGGGGDLFGHFCFVLSSFLSHTNFDVVNEALLCLKIYHLVLCSEINMQNIDIMFQF